MFAYICINAFIARVVLFTLILLGLVTFLSVSTSTSTKRPHPSSTVVDGTSTSQSIRKKVDGATRERVGNVLSDLPLRFEENKGRVDEHVRFVARGQGYQLFLTSTEAVLTLRRGSKSDKAQGKDASHIRNTARAEAMSVVMMQLLGANSQATISGEQQLETSTTYFIGDDKSKWHAATSYSRVRYERVYPGIDMIYHGRQQELEYDFEVSPGADPKAIGLEFKGVNKLKIDEHGELVLKVKGGGEIRQHRPVTYQVIGGERREVESRYVLKGRNRVGFKVGEYDRTEMLVIDPVVSYSSYLGGSNSDRGNGIAVDSAGNVYVTGQTNSINFPVLNQYQTDSQTDSSTGPDVFVTKINPNASGSASLLYSTYLGGNGGDSGVGIAVDNEGNAYVTGGTNSANFPVLNQYQTNAQTDASVASDVFVTKLNTNVSGTSSLLYSTYLGGNGSDTGLSIAIDGKGDAYITGYTGSITYPVLNQFQSDPGDNTNDVFVTRLNTNLSGAASLLYSTYLAGDSIDEGGGIAVDSAGNAYVTGETLSTNFPTLNQYQSDQLGYDAFVAKLNTNLSGDASLLYSTYLGGSSGDYGRAIAADDAGSAYITGYTTSNNFPTLNQYQSDPGDNTDDVFVTKLNTNASGMSSLLYSTYLGGSNGDFGRGIAVDSSGNAYVTGETHSIDYPVLNQHQTNAQTDGSTIADVFVTKLGTNSSSVASLLYSTYVGGGSDDFGYGIAIDSTGNTYVTGRTSSNNYPTFNQYQTNAQTDSSADDTANADAFVTKIRFSFSPGDYDGRPSITSLPPPSLVNLDSSAQFKHTFTATGSPSPTFSVTSGTLPSGLTLSPSGLLSGYINRGGLYENITVTASNGVASPATQTFSIKVNIAPYGAGETYNTAVNTKLDVGAPGVLSKIQDGNGDALTAVLERSPSFGSVILNPNGSFTYTPNPGFKGVDHFTFQADDGYLKSGPIQISIVVLSGGTLQLPSGEGFSVREDAGNAIIQILRLDGTYGTTTVAYKVTDGTARAGIDYTPVNGTVTFENNQWVGTFTIPIIDDSILEENKTINITIYDVTGTGTLGTQTTSVFTIIDDDAPVVMTQGFTRRAIALDSVTQMPSPFRLTNPFNFSKDKRTRVSLFVWKLELLPGEDTSAVEVQAQDALGRIYILPIESIDAVPGIPWLKQVVVKLPDDAYVPGDLWMIVSLRGATSNLVFIRLVP
jgi:hypothetical protein